MQSLLPLSLFLLVTGAAAGSFLALWAERLPHGEGVVLRGSRCRGCGARIGWRDLVPVVSWLSLGGRCRGCGATVPRWLWHAELGGVALAAAAILVAPTPALMALGALWLWLLMGLALCDLTAMRLPDPLNAALLATGLGLGMSGPGTGAALIGAGAGAGAFLTIRLAYQALRGREGLGMGDVKLMAGIGAGLGWQALPLVALIASLCALGVTLALRHGRVERDAEIPFGAYLCAAAALVWIATIGTT
ncbi:prepilin peptidase [Roseovarius ramblicola]|uniref:Prepilin leader peptidase/N-methyltransferase n=1 Tax=Roseovarius ramblicola TaxID=2022336 RepID=A0ABV5HY98_9RHOB